MLEKSYSKDTFDLENLNKHNGIEHDASLLSTFASYSSIVYYLTQCLLSGEDVYFQADQGVPHLPLIKELLACATGKDKDGNPLLTPADLSRISAKRRVEARAANPEFSLSTFHKIFGSSKYDASLFCILGVILIVSLQLIYNAHYIRRPDS